MSFTIVEPARFRLNRSQLFVPGIRPELLPKAAKGAADIINIDLEDSVPVAEKPRARANVVKALTEVDFGDKTVSVRINACDTHFMYRDLVDLIEGGGERLDLVMLPKIGTAADIYAVDMLVTQIEAAVGRKKKLGFEIIIESALGMANVEAIAAASPRNESLHFGPADYAASIKARTVGIGGFNADYAMLADAQPDGSRPLHFGDPWHFALSRIAVAARARGLRAVDGPYGNFSDPEGFKAQARRSVSLGYEGKWAIHPSQVALANDMFSPTEAEVGQAKRILDAMEQARKDGLGAVTLDGKLIDLASIRQAQVMVQASAIIAGRGA